MKTSHTLKMATAMLALALGGGCAITPLEQAKTDTSDPKDREILRLSEILDSQNLAFQELEAREAETRRLNAELEQRNRAAAERAKALAAKQRQAIVDLEMAKMSSVDSDTVVNDSLLPPNAKPGECYARVYIPPTYKTVEERVLIQEASEDVEIVPATFEWVEEEVVIKEASERVEIVPATYEEREEKILVTPATTRSEPVPAVYEWVEEKVLVRPARTEWKKGRGPMEKVDNATGEIMCLLEIPAEYKTVRKKVLKTAASTRTVEVPAEYTTVSKTVMVTPETMRKVQIPAVTKKVKVKKVVTPAQKRVTPIPAEYATVQKKVADRPGGIGWRRVLCETNLRVDVIKKIQQALADAGFDPGEIDGFIGPQTDAAVKAFQSANGLAVGGLTFETLIALGLDATPEDEARLVPEPEDQPIAP